MAGNNTFLVRGIVRYRGGLPIPHAHIKAFNINLRGQNLLGEGTTNDNGKFLIEFTKDKYTASNKIAPDIQIRVYNPADSSELIGESGVRFGSTPDEKFKVVIESINENVWSEFEQVQQEIEAILQGTNITDLVESDQRKDITYIAGHTRIKHRKIRAFIQAHKLSDETKKLHKDIPPEFFYGLIRSGLPSDWPGLLTQGSEAIKQSTQEAVKKIWIPWTARDHINDYLQKFTEIRIQAALGNLGETSLIDEIIEIEIADKALREKFYIQYYSLVHKDGADINTDEIDTETALEDFWRFVKSDTELQGYYYKLQSTLKIATLVGGDLHITKVLRNEREAVRDASGPRGREPYPALSFIAQKLRADWVEVLKKAYSRSRQLPPGIIGRNLAVKRDHYAKILYDKIESAMPNLVLRERLLLDAKTAAPVKAFLVAIKQARKTIDFTSDVIAKQLETLIRQTRQSLSDSDKEIVFQELKTCQVLYRVSRRYDAYRVLRDADISSAFDIVRKGRNDFIRTFSEALKGTVAVEEVYENAHYIVSTVLNVYGQISPAFNQAQLRVLGNEIDAFDDDADWETLFGSQDSCQCQHCQSVLSPAAYLLELLNFLEARKTTDGRSLRDVVKERRPDIESLELTCENSHSTIPYIDIVLELLENRLAPVKFSLSSDLKNSLVDRNLDQEIRAAFLNQGGITLSDKAAVVGCKKEGSEETSWHIIDTGCRYKAVVSENDGELQVISRTSQSREGDGSGYSAHYFNRKAYQRLAEAKRPWGAVFNLHLETARTFLEHLKAPLWELKRSFSGIQPDEIYTSKLFLAEVLNLADENEWNSLLVGTDRIEDYYPLPITNSAGNRKITFILHAAQISFEEFEEIRKSRFVNLGVVSEEGSCAVEKMSLEHFNKSDAVNLRLFVHLQRRLGWSVADLDTALDALKFPGPTAAEKSREGALKKLALLKLLMNRLSLTVQPLLSLWGHIETKGTEPYYSTLFIPEAVKGTDLELVDGALPATAEAKSLETVLPLLQGALQVSEKELRPALDALPKNKITLENLARLRAITLLADSFDLSIKEILLSVTLSGAKLFDSNHSEDVVVITELLEIFSTKRVDINEVAYLVSHEDADKVQAGPRQQQITHFVKKLREELNRPIPDGFPDSGEWLATQAASVVQGEFKFDELFTQALLKKAFVTDSKPVVKALTDPSFISSTTDVPEEEPATGGYYAWIWKAYILLYKAKLLTEHFSFDSHGNKWLVVGSSDDVKESFLNSLTLRNRNWKNNYAHYLSIASLAKVFDRESFLQEISEDLFELIQDTSLDTHDKYIARLTQLVDWDKRDLKNVVEGKSIRCPGQQTVKPLTERSAFAHPTGLATILEGLLALRRLGTNHETASKLTEQAEEWHASTCRDLVRAKYDSEDWSDVARQRLDPLLKKRREALGEFFIEESISKYYSGPSAEKDILSWNDLESELLIGVKMNPGMDASRIVQAYLSIHRFVNQCLSGWEDKIVVDTDADPGWHDWYFLQNYRVWEARQRIFMTPENWIEPELRDEKTPFFKDLENEIQQNEISEEVAEAALRHYLEKLDEVANLKILAFYRDEQRGKGNANKVLYVFARTRGVPSTYYFRKRIGGARWTAWEKIDLDISGDHLIPVVWNRRLYLFWPVFTEKTITGKDEEATVRWSIQLAWSEYFGKKWSAKKKTAEDQLSIHGPGGKEHDNNRGLHAFRSEFVGDELRIHWCAYSLGQLIQSEYQEDRDFYWQPPDIEKSGYFQFTGYGNRVYTKPTKRMALRKLTGITYEANALVEMDSDSAFLPRQFNIQSDGMVLKKTPGEIPYRWVIDTQYWKFNSTSPYFFEDDQRCYLVESKPLLKFAQPHLDCIPESRLSLGLIDKFRFDSFQMVHPVSAVRIDASGTLWPKIAEKPAFIEPTTEAFSMLKVSAGATRANAATLQPLESGRSGSSKPNQIYVNVFRQQKSLLADAPDTNYQFRQFDLPFIHSYLKELANKGLDGLFSTALQRKVKKDFYERYLPARLVQKPYPVQNVDFSYPGALSAYNWELFFHVPFQIAVKLSQNQQFDAARKWFHYIFNPTSKSGSSIPQKFWNTLPLKKAADKDLQRESLRRLIQQLISGDTNTELAYQIKDWQEQPFNPHAIARMRLMAYQKAVVMKYLDNLIAQADNLFRSDRREAIEKASVLYNEAAEILGEKPRLIQKEDSSQSVLTFETLTDEKTNYHRHLKELELYVDIPSSSNDVGRAKIEDNGLVRSSMLYFCIPQNQKLLDYWDIIGDRQFKINNCQNIEGVSRPLRLLDPPIDPALLVRAAAAGLDLSQVLSDLYSPRPLYRFESMIQFARQLCSHLTELGGKLLAALEKKDAAELELLRADHEVKLQNQIREIYKEKVKESNESLKGLRETKKLVTIRRDYYQSRKKISSKEKRQLEKLYESDTFSRLSGATQAGAAAATYLPQIGYSGFSPTMFTGGGTNIGPAVQAATILFRMRAEHMSHHSRMAEVEAGHERRWDEWKHQGKMALQELKQLDKQLAAAEIRLAIAEYELRNYEKQMEHSRETLDFIKTKFTSKELYDWMVNQLSELHFKAYQLAYDVAKQTERAFQYDLAEWDTQYVRFGRWNSLKKGLLSGERLMSDLNDLEAAYKRKNKRHDEFTKKIPLSLLNPEAFIQLKQKGECEFELNEKLFDMDHCGQYLRRIKGIALTIPCVRGPYQNINAKLSLEKEEIRKDDTLLSGKYEKQNEGQDPRFDDKYRKTEHLRTSHAQNDTGQFEFHFRDDRLLKFEGAGVISTWKLELPPENNNYDLESVSEVVLTVHYTAQESNDARFIEKAKESISPTNGRRLISVRHSYPHYWRSLASDDPPKNHLLELPLTTATLWPGKRHSVDKIDSIDLFITPKEGADSFKVLISEDVGNLNFDDSHFNEDSYKVTLSDAGNDYPGLLTGKKEFRSDPDERWGLCLKSENTSSGGVQIEDMLMVVNYSLKKEG